MRAHSYSQAERRNAKTKALSGMSGRIAFITPMKSHLNISTSLYLPLDGVTQKFAILGRTGSGKSYCATKLCEEMLDNAAQVIALDPVGVWYGLRTGASYAIPIFGGLHGDVPLEPGAGEFIANLIVDRGISAVLDVSQFLSGQQAQFAYDFATRFFFRKKSSPSPVHLFVEECQEFVPQNISTRGGFEAKMLNAFERLIKLGRNFGIGATLISQRPQEVNKKALNQAECMFAFQMTGPQERKAVASWVADKAGSQDVIDALPKLAIGECHVWSPQWLQVDKNIRVAAKKTKDVSSTPVAGIEAAKVKPLNSNDLSILHEQMHASIQRAKDDDPRELKKTIGELRAKLERADRALIQAMATQEVKTIEKPILADGQLEKLDKAIHLLAAAGEVMLSKLANTVLPIETAARELREALSKLTTPAKIGQGQAPAHGSRMEAPRVMAPARTTPGSAQNSSLAPRHQDIVNAIAFYNSIGVLRCDKKQIAGFVTRPFNGNFRSDLAVLRTAGLVDYPTPGDVILTDDGSKAVTKLPDIRSQSDLHALWLQKLAPRHADILRWLLKMEGETAKLTLAGNLNREFNGNFRSDLSVLRTLGTIVYPNPGTVAVSPNLYPPIPA